MDLKTLRNKYIEGLKSPEIKTLEKMISQGADYPTLYKYVTKTSGALSKAFDLLTPEEVGEVMTLDMAEELVRPLLADHSERIADRAEKVQASLNAENDVSLKARKVTPSQDRQDGLIKRLTSGPYIDSEWVLHDGIASFALSIVDAACKLNAEQQYKAGLTPIITRKAGWGGCCRWCRQWAGTWTYPGVPQDVFLRHRGCDCIVEYKNGKMKQDVHSKRWSELDGKEVVKEPGAALTTKQAKDYEDYLKRTKREKEINALAEERGITYEQAKREHHLQMERIRDRERYRRGQRRRARRK